MELAINLRSDLKKLGDAELAVRFEEIWRQIHAAEADIFPLKLRWSSRGIFRHPLAYPFLSFVSYGGPLSINVGLPVQLGIISLLWPKSRFRPLLQMHLGLCEARDVADEIQRRITNRP
jgi:hypothetical protein